MGRLPRHRVPRRRRARDRQPQREAAHPLLPRSRRPAARPTCPSAASSTARSSSPPSTASTSTASRCASTRPSRASRCWPEETPAAFVAFDLLAEGDDRPARAPVPRAARPARSGRWPTRSRRCYLTPATTDRDAGRGVVRALRGRRASTASIAKPLDGEYEEGKRTHAEGEAPAHRRLRGRRVPHAQGRRRASGRCCSGCTTTTASCTTSAWRAASPPRPAPSCSPSSSPTATARSTGTRGAVGRGRRRGRSLGPGSADPARRAGGTRARTSRWEPLRIELVAEVAYEHLQGDRFRHTARFQRWRPTASRRRAPTSSSTPVPMELRDLRASDGFDLTVPGARSGYFRTMTNTEDPPGSWAASTGLPALPRSAREVRRGLPEGDRRVHPGERLRRGRQRQLDVPA